MIRRPPRSTPLYSSAASDVYKCQAPAYALLSRNQFWCELRAIGYTIFSYFQLLALWKCLFSWKITNFVGKIVKKTTFMLQKFAMVKYGVFVAKICKHALCACTVRDIWWSPLARQLLPPCTQHRRRCVDEIQKHKTGAGCRTVP